MWPLLKTVKHSRNGWNKLLVLKLKWCLLRKSTFNFLTPLQTNLSKQPRYFYNIGKHDTVWHTWDQTKEYYTPNQQICNLKIVNKIYSPNRLRLEQTLCHSTIEKRWHDLKPSQHESLGQKRDLPSGNLKSSESLPRVRSVNQGPKNQTKPIPSQPFSPSSVLPKSPKLLNPVPGWKRSEMCNHEMAHKRILLNKLTHKQWLIFQSSYLGGDTAGMKGFETVFVFA